MLQILILISCCYLCMGQSIDEAVNTTTLGIEGCAINNELITDICLCGAGTCGKGSLCDGNNCIPSQCPTDNIITKKCECELTTCLPGNICKEKICEPAPVCIMDTTVYTKFCTCGNSTCTLGKTCVGGTKCKIPGATDGGWSAWSGCSNTCGKGIQIRRCNNPEKSSEGEPCLGKDKQECIQAKCLCPEENKIITAIEANCSCNGLPCGERNICTLDGEVPDLVKPICTKQCEDGRENLAICSCGCYFGRCRSTCRPGDICVGTRCTQKCLEGTEVTNACNCGMRNCNTGFACIKEVCIESCTDRIVIANRYGSVSHTEFCHCNGAKCDVGKACVDKICTQACKPDTVITQHCHCDGQLCSVTNSCIDEVCTPACSTNSTRSIIQDPCNCNGAICHVGNMCFGASCVEECPENVPATIACHCAGVSCEPGKVCEWGLCNKDDEGDEDQGKYEYEEGKLPEDYLFDFKK